MIRNFIEGQEIKILEYLQDENAVTDNLLEENGITPSAISRSGLNKTRVLKHLPNLKIKQLVISKKIRKKGRPGNYYAITPVGSFLLFKNRLENANEDDERQSEVEKIRYCYPLISKHWDKELLDLDNYRHQTLFETIDFSDFKLKKNNYVSLSITLPSGRNFITIEKHYFLVTTPQENSNDETIRKLFDINEAKKFILNEVELDLRNFITFLFYYNLVFKAKSTLKIIEKAKEESTKNKQIRTHYHQQLVECAKRYKSLGYDFNFNDSKRLEMEIIKRSDGILKIVESIIGKDKDLENLIRKYCTEIGLTFKSIMGNLILK